MFSNENLTGRRKRRLVHDLQTTVTIKKSKVDVCAIENQAQVTTTLWEHQKECVQKMRHREHIMFSACRNIGILCDDLASGKTVSVLATVIQHKRLTTDYRSSLYERTPFPRVLID